jgi:hypothetical protein
MRMPSASGRGVCLRPVEGGLHAEVLDQRLGARHDCELLVDPLLDAGLELPAEGALELEVLLHPVVERAALGKRVVLDAHARGARLLELPDEPDGVDRVAAAGVAVDEDGDVDTVDDLLDDADVVLRAEDVGVGQAMRCMDFEARDPEPVRTGLLRDLRPERVVHAEQHGRLRAGQELTDRRRAVRERRRCVRSVRASAL